ncbi:23S rRNA (uracil(1939)-C(5))-methyltransferase RlmD [Slackia heliotrinireducens]|uniref:23S rRNA (uracil(1939)-C(5))-methyltransferase RlmD n=1 Tax=Slackia heliotrinireducens TaxID=84110 RepID=UPI0033151FC2
MSEQITIERLLYGDAGIGHLSDGRAAFVDGACPGDVLEVAVEKDNGNYLTCSIMEIVSPSEHRVTPKCPLASVCGGCGWQHVAYDWQLVEKRANVVSQLQRTAHFDPDRAEAVVAECKPSPKQFGYRNKLEFGCQIDPKRGFLMGLHRRGSDDVLPVDSCPLAQGPLSKTPKALKGALRYLSGSNDLGIYRVGVRQSARTRSTEIALWTTPGPFPRATVAKTLGNAMKCTSIVRVMTGEGKKARKLKGVELLAGDGYWKERVAGQPFKVSAPSFFQVNTEQAETLVELALDGLEIDEGSVVADLYCGVGTFTIPMAKTGAEVMAVESYGSSVRDLRRITEEEGLYIDVIGGDAARELPGLGHLDALLVDPPRAGLDATIIPAIAAAGPRRLAYVSCDPATWARDVKRLEDQGFELVKATPVDMFPQTHHVEIVSIFTNRKN